MLIYQIVTFGFAGGLSLRNSNPEMREFGIFYRIGNGFIHCFWHKGNKKYGSEDSTRDTVILANF